MKQIMHIQLTFADALGLLDWIFVDDFYPGGQPLSSDEKAIVLDKHFPCWWERVIAEQKGGPLGPFSTNNKGNNEERDNHNKRTTVGFDEFARFFTHLYYDVLALYPRIEGQGLAQGNVPKQHGDDHPVETLAATANGDVNSPNAAQKEVIVTSDGDIGVQVAKKQQVDRAVISLEPKLSTRQSEAILQSISHPRHNKNMQLFRSQLFLSNTPSKDPAMLPKHQRPDGHHRTSLDKLKEETKDDEGILYHNRPQSAQIMIRNILQRKTINLKYIKSNVVLAAAGEDKTSELLSRFQLSGGVLEDISAVSSPDRNNQTVLLPNRLLLSPLSPDEMVIDHHHVPVEVMAQRKARLMRNLLSRPTTNPSLRRLGLNSSTDTSIGDYDPRLERNETTTTSMRRMFYQDGVYEDDQDESPPDF